MTDPDAATRQQQQERDARQAEAERLRYIRLVQQTNRKLEMIMHTMDEILMAVAAQKGQIDSLATLTKSIKDKLSAALNPDPATQAKIDAVFKEVSDNTSAITKAINTNDDDPSNDPAPDLIATSVTVASSANPSLDGSKVTLTAGVTSMGSTVDAITGSVVFYADAAAIGTAALDSTGVAALDVTPPVGSHDITASYSGDAKYAKSDSAEFTQVVNAATPPADAPVDGGAAVTQ